MRFIHSNLVNARTAATEVLKIDLPVNPLSHLIITLDGYNATDEATLAEIIAFINKVTISHMGTTVFEAESEDISGVQTYILGSMPELTQSIATDNAARSLSLIIPFGRRLFNPNECFPATKKGELTLSLDYTAPSSSMDNGQLYIDAVEIIDASPAQYLKTTMLSVSAPGATGDNDTDLPIGNDIICVQLRMTTFPATSSHTYGATTAKILVDNTEYGYSLATAHALVGFKPFYRNSLPRDIAAFGNEYPDNIVWLDFDPYFAGEYLLPTEGKSSVKLRANMGVDEALYLTILELVKVS